MATRPTTMMAAPFRIARITASAASQTILAKGRRINSAVCSAKRSRAVEITGSPEKLEPKYPVADVDDKVDPDQEREPYSARELKSAAT